MWICTRCQTSNEEGQGRCIQCGASRSARRFGAGTPVPAPSVTEGVPTVRATAPVQEAPVPPPTGRADAAVRTRSSSYAEPGRRVVRCAMGRALVVFGLMLAVLLPLLVALLAVVHAETVKPVLLGVLLPAGTVSPPVLDTALYALCAVAASLLLLLPGLTAAGLGRLLIRLTPPERRS